MDTENNMFKGNGESVEDAPVSDTVGKDEVPVTPAEEASVPKTAASETEPPAADPPATGLSGHAPGPDTPPEGAKAKKTFLRACGSWTDIFPIAGMLSVILIYAGAILSLALDGWIIPAEEIARRLLGDADSAEFLMDYFDFYGIWIVFMLVILIFRDNRPMWKAFLYNGHGNTLKAVLTGSLLGFGMNGFCILMSVIMGDIKLSYSGFKAVPFFTFLLCVMIQSGAEEITNRCYLYQKLRRRYRWPVIAVLVNSLLFMSMHMANPGVTYMGLLQVFLIGVLFSLIVYYWDSLWTVIWAHTAWNFSQSIVFGLPNSGIVSKYSVFKLEAASARDGLFYSTSFGVEGSIGANGIIAAMIVLILIYGFVTKRGERMDHWAELEERDTGKNHIWEAVVLTVIMAAIIAAGALGTKWLSDHAEELQQYTQEIEESMMEEQAQPGEAADQVQPGQTAEQKE